MDVLEVSDTLDAINDNPEVVSLAPHYQIWKDAITSVDKGLNLDNRKITTTHEDPALVQALPSELLGGVSVIPVTSVRVMNPDRLKAWVDTPVLTPMPQPITTSYASLTIDKLPSSQILVPASKSSFHSAAALKSVHVLSKFWGDEVEKVEEVMEDTLSHDQRLGMEDYPSLSKSIKAERKKKKQMNKVKPSSFNSAGMRTRAQKGTSKADLTDT